MKVLLATDGSKHAEEAAWLLARLPHEETLELTIMSVTPTLEFHGTMEVVEWIKQNAEAEKIKAQELCESVAQIFEGADVNIDLHVAEGHPGESIVAEAEALKVDLIVVGAVGQNLIKRILLGSVSDFVATHAKCSVLVVRQTGLHNREHRDFGICLAYDNSPAAKFATRQLAKFGWRSHTRLDVVSLFLFPLTYSEIPLDLDTEAIKGQMREVLDEAMPQIKKISPDARSHVIDANHIGDRLVQFAEERKSDMVVMGNTGRGLLARVVMGSVSRYVLRHAHCSVWIARERVD